VALVGGADGFSRLAFLGFMRLRVMAGGLCRPFDEARDGLLVGEGAVPQEWTIRMTSDEGDYELVGAIMGPDGRGNNGEDFVSDSGQVEIPTALWRRRQEADGTYSNRTGDTFVWTVYRSSVGEVKFGGEAGVFEEVMAENLENGWHEVVLRSEGEAAVSGFRVFEPPRFE
jgi:hypothetical protein